MRPAAGLEHDLDAGLEHVQRGVLADVLGAEDVPAVLGDECEQRGQTAGPVVDPGEQPQPPPGGRLVAGDDRGHEPGIDVATGEHDRGRAVAGRRDPAREDRRDADRPAALDDQLRPLHQPHHRVGHLVVARPRAAHRRSARRAGAVSAAGALHRDPVGDRWSGTHGRGDGSAEGVEERRRRVRLDADDPHAGPSGLHRAGDSRRAVRRHRRAPRPRRDRGRRRAARGRASTARGSRRGHRTGGRTGRRSPPHARRAAAMQSSTAPGASVTTPPNASTAVTFATGASCGMNTSHGSRCARAA